MLDSRTIVGYSPWETLSLLMTELPTVNIIFFKPKFSTPITSPSIVWNGAKFHVQRYFRQLNHFMD